MSNYNIKSHEWQIIYNILLSLNKIRIREELGTRKFIEGVYFVLRTGCQWRLLPPSYGRWRSVHKRFLHWCALGVWDCILKELSQEADLENVMIDATIIRAHPCAAGYKKDSQEAESLGRCVGGFTTKIHAIVDSLGQMIKFVLTPGQRHDVTQASALLSDIKGVNILADKGYDSDNLINQIKNQQCVVVIPPKANRLNQRYYDKHI